MHNLHFIVTNADSHEDAICSIESEILDWGNENNWRSVFAAMSVHDQSVFFADDDSRFNNIVESTYNSIKSIEEAINSDIQSVPYLDIALQFKSGDSQLTELDYYKLEKYARHMHEAFKFKHKPYEIKSMQNYFEYQYDEFGITDFRCDGDPESSYIVFIDMHS
ncbi:MULTISPECIES: hypothetical protein [Cysteiniphilum]|uniref:hypothetical protein n=1 Tax=Cysteiniphilum TaxID=2056696 RepID=UPI00177B4021|nr:MULTISPECIES: hypothetical protein [Cysteiniphilum]